MMKKMVMTGVWVIFGLIFSGPAGAGISNSAHDFSGAAWSGGQICNPCHAPHSGATSVANAPLWSHDLTTLQNYTLYTSATLDSTPGQPDGISKLCLSCHDGTIAIDSFGGDVGTTFIGGGRRVGTDLRGNHPLSIIYDSALAAADSGLNDPATAASGMGGTVEEDMLFANRLECASCHDVHDASGNESLLRVSNQGSQLCLTCHGK